MWVHDVEKDSTSMNTEWKIKLEEIHTVCVCCICIRIHTHIDVHMYMYIHMYVYMYTHIYVLTGIYADRTLCGVMH